MKKALYVLLSALLSGSVIHSQDLNWNTAGYTTGNLSHYFGTIGSPASTVSMNISGNTNRISGSYPIIYTANPTGTADDCSVPCALRSSVTFTTTTETIIYTFTFSSAVSGLSFRIYDIDGDDASSGDQAAVTATGPGGAKNVTMTASAATITGSGTTTATARGTQGNTTDDFADINISTSVSSLVITYSNNPNNPSAGNRSFSIGNMSWSGVLPVKWIAFSGKTQNNGAVDLKWTVEDGTSSDYYIIERSKNGQVYFSAGQVASASAGRNTYSFTDINPGSGNSFYRIKQVEKTGQYEFSNIVLIKEGKSNDPLFTVFPNPASDYIIVNAVRNAQISKLQVYDANGRMLYQSQNGKNRIETAMFKPGVYGIRIQDASGEIYTASFLKQ